MIAETIDLIDDLQLVGFIDDQLEKGTLLTADVRVIGSVKDIEAVSGQCDTFVMGIGNNEIRKQVMERHSNRMNFETVIHPRAVVSKTASIQAGTIVLAGAVINANTKIGTCCIINSNVVVDHDCAVGDFTHLTIGTLVGSNSEIGDLLKTDIGQAIPAFSVIG